MSSALVLGWHRGLELAAVALTVVVDLLSGYCKHNPSTWSNFPSSQGCALGAGTNSGFGWQRFKGRVGILMLVLAYSEGLGLGRALLLETSLFIFKQMSTGSISHLVSDNTCCVGSICPKREGATSWVWTVQVFSGSLGTSLARASGCCATCCDSGWRILALWQICIFLQATHHRPGQLEPICVEQNYF